MKIVSTPKQFPNFFLIFKRDLKKTVDNIAKRLRTHLLTETKRLLSGPAYSAPGMPPGKKSGRLIRNLNCVIQDKTVRFGVKRGGRHGILLDRGTGLYGPHGSRIIPVRARFLKFKYKGKLVFARSVRGAKRRPWINKLPKIFKSFK